MSKIYCAECDKDVEPVITVPYVEVEDYAPGNPHLCVTFEMERCCPDCDLVLDAGNLPLALEVDPQHWNREIAKVEWK